MDKLNAYLEAAKNAPFSEIDPSIIVGFRDGNYLDFHLYDMLGFRHPKRESYYAALHSLPTASPEIVSIYEGIATTKKIDQPILLHYTKEGPAGKPGLVVIDGATRLSCIGFLRLEFPEEFQSIPAALFRGSDDSARIEMVVRNQTGRSRPLDPDEFAAAIARFHELGWDLERIEKSLGVSARMHGTIEHFLLLHKKGSDELKQALREKRISLANAFSLARLSSKKQREIIAEAGMGKKIRATKIWAAHGEKNDFGKLFNEGTRFRMETQAACTKSGIMDDDLLSLFWEIQRIQGKIQKAMMRKM